MTKYPLRNFFFPNLEIASLSDITIIHWIFSIKILFLAIAVSRIISGCITNVIFLLKTLMFIKLHSFNHILQIK